MAENNIIELTPFRADLTRRGKRLPAANDLADEAAALEPLPDEPLDRLERAFVSALLGPHPLHGGFDPAKAVKAFACLADIEAAQVRLKRLVEQIRRQA